MKLISLLSVALVVIAAISGVKSGVDREIPAAQGRTFKGSDNVSRKTSMMCQNIAYHYRGFTRQDWFVQVPPLPFTSLIRDCDDYCRQLYNTGGFRPRNRGKCCCKIEQGASTSAAPPPATSSFPTPQPGPSQLIYDENFGVEDFSTPQPGPSQLIYDENFGVDDFSTSQPGPSQLIYDENFGVDDVPTGGQINFRY